MRSRLTSEQFDILFRSILMAAGSIALTAMGILTITGYLLIFFFMNYDYLFLLGRRIFQLLFFTFKFQERSHHGLVDFIHSWIRLTQKITFLSLLQYRNISPLPGVLSILIFNYWFFFFLLGYTTVLLNLPTPTSSLFCTELLLFISR